jgi:hypothetical protein
MTSFELEEEQSATFSTTSQAGSTAGFSAGKPRRTGRSPRARRAARRLLRATATDNSNQMDARVERFLFFPCTDCPHHKANVQCFRRVLLSTTAWNRLRHLDTRKSLADERPIAAAMPIRQETETWPATADDVFALYRTIRPPAVCTE